MYDAAFRLTGWVEDLQLPDRYVPKGYYSRISWTDYIILTILCINCLRVELSNAKEGEKGWGVNSMTLAPILTEEIPIHEKVARIGLPEQFGFLTNCFSFIIMMSLQN